MLKAFKLIQKIDFNNKYTFQLIVKDIKKKFKNNQEKFKRINLKYY